MQRSPRTRMTVISLSGRLRKGAGFCLVALFVASLVIMAFDSDHIGMFISHCPVCKAKRVLGNASYSHPDLDTYGPFTWAYIATPEHSFDGFSFRVTRSSRAPPVFS